MSAVGHLVPLRICGPATEGKKLNLQRIGEERMKRDFQIIADPKLMFCQLNVSEGLIILLA